MVDLEQLRAAVASPAPHPEILGDSFPVTRNFLRGVLEELEALRLRAGIVDTVTDVAIAA
jgi:hypothetical protein